MAAAQDLRWLLERGYPREKCLTLVGNRRGLNGPEREILRRAVYSPSLAARRRAKLAGLEGLKGRPVGLDGHNLVLTLESALSGRIMVRGDDTALRDIARSAAGWRWSDLTARVTGLILDALITQGAAEARFWFDSPVSHSGRLAGLFRDELARRGLPGGAEAVPVPEKPLKVFSGLVASADGDLIDNCLEPIDLAGLMVEADLTGIFDKVAIVEL